jgi:dTDP-4-amino-4,6-dideoxygalactose transaminase
LIQYLKDKGITSVFHYIPLHSSVAGKKYSRFNGDDYYTSRESQRLLRLPFYSGLDFNDINYIVDSLYNFFRVPRV